MNRLAPLLAAGCVAAAGVYIATRSRGAPAPESLPQWSCNSGVPPVHDVPAGLLARSGFQDRADLERFVAAKREPLTWTYFAVQNVLRPSELAALRCFQSKLEGRSAAVARSVQTRLTWHLLSDGRRAIASRFELADFDGPPELAEPVRSCLDQHLFGRTFVAMRATKAELLKFDGVFPFHRKIRFPVQPAPSAETATAARTGS
jgi:hypothetical protein